MSSRLSTRFAGAVGFAILSTTVANGYIHFPPMTLPKMCKDSHQIRVLKVTKFDKEKGVIVFAASDSLKGEKSQITAFKHAIRIDAEGVKPIFEWAEVGKTAVMFSIESKPNFAPKGIGYVFIDKYCYSVDYNDGGKFWLLIRAEPDMSACFHGSVEKLQATVTAILEGKEVKVPVKEPATKEDRDKRYKEVNEILKKNR